MLLFALLPAIMTGCTSRTGQKETETGIHADAAAKNPMLLYVGTYTRKEGHVNGKATGVYVYRMDTATGALEYVSTSPSTTNPSYLAIDPGGRFLYAVNETGSNNPDSSGTITAFALKNGGRELAFINSVTSAGNYPCHIMADQKGKWLVVSNYGSGNNALFPIEPDGRIGMAVAADQHTGKGPTPRQQQPHAHMAVISANNKFVYACDLGTDRIYVYRLLTSPGKLAPTPVNYHTQPGAGPRHMVLHPNLQTAYVVGELNGTIECMRVDTVSGKLSRFQVMATLTEGNPNEASCADIQITPSGKFLYASNRGTYNTIAMYAIDDVSGELTWLGSQHVKGKTPRSFVIDPTGQFLLVANQDSDNIVTFRIHPESGKLMDTGVESNVPTPVCLKFMPRL